MSKDQDGEKGRESANVVVKVVEKLNSQVLIYALGSAALLIAAGFSGDGVLNTLLVPLMIIIGIGFGAHVYQERVRTKARENRSGAERPVSPSASAVPVVAPLQGSWPSAIGFVLLVLVVVALSGDEKPDAELVNSAKVFLVGSISLGVWGIISTWRKWHLYKWEWMGWTSVVAGGLLMIGLGSGA